MKEERKETASRLTETYIRSSHLSQGAKVTFSDFISVGVFFPLSLFLSLSFPEQVSN